MSQHAIQSAKRPDPDQALVDIADYILNYDVTRSRDAMETARYCLMDTLGCGILALNYPACTKLLGPVVPGATMPGGARVPGTPYELDPVRAAFNIGAMIRWLDYNDTWQAAEWGPPLGHSGRHSGRGRLPESTGRGSRQTTAHNPGCPDRNGQSPRSTGRHRPGKQL